MGPVSILTTAVGAMNGYSDEAGFGLKGGPIAKWFLITTPLFMITMWSDVEKKVQGPAARVASVVTCAVLANGLFYCIGSKFGRITHEFQSGFKPPLLPLPPPRQPLLLLPPVTWTPSTASPAALPDLPKGSSYTAAAQQPQMR
jgi:hypothetical protein